MPDNADPRVARFRALVARFPDRSPPRFSLARALQDAGQLEEAAQRYAEAAERQPDLMMAWLHRGECLFELERTEEARQAAEEALRLALAQGHDGPEAEARELLEEIDEA